MTGKHGDKGQVMSFLKKCETGGAEERLLMTSYAV